MISQPVTPQHLLTQPAAACCLAAVSRITLRAYDLATPDLATPPLGRYPLVAIPTWFAPSRDMQELTQRRAVQDHYILWFPINQTTTYRSPLHLVFNSTVYHYILWFYIAGAFLPLFAIRKQRIS